MQLKRTLLALLYAPLLTQAAVLPEERADALYHRYEGGGMTIDGPSVLVRKNIAERVSLSANYYADKVSAASIDVVTTASPYTEERDEYSFGADYLAGKAIYSLKWTQSEESDYSARNISFGASQDFFGDLTTLSFGYARGNDIVRRRDDALFEEEVMRQQFRIGVTQVLTRNMLMALSHEFVSDEGYLNNPYRSVRYQVGGSYSFQPEVYPQTRSSEATALRASYYLPWRAGLHAEHRWYADSWGVNSTDWALVLVQPWQEKWEFEFRARYYQQEAADFYSDLFPFQNAQNFLARDKELSTFTSTSFGAAAGYTFFKGRWQHADRFMIRLSLDHYRFDYDDFRDIRVAVAVPGEEPLYGFSAWVTQLLFSVWY
jgi:hypothetical protein